MSFQIPNYKLYGIALIIIFGIEKVDVGENHVTLGGKVKLRRQDLIKSESSFQRLRFIDNYGGLAGKSRASKSAGVLVVRRL
jgi:hypothetical protein